MGKLKADTDLLGFFLIDCSVADNDKSCDVLLIMADIFCKEIQARTAALLLCLQWLRRTDPVFH